MPETFKYELGNMKTVFLKKNQGQHMVLEITATIIGAFWITIGTKVDLTTLLRYVYFIYIFFVLLVDHQIV